MNTLNEFAKRIQEQQTEINMNISKISNNIINSLECLKLDIKNKVLKTSIEIEYQIDEIIKDLIIQ